MGDADGSNVDCNTKKVRFKDMGDDSAENMVVDTALASEIYWKYKLLGRKNTGSLASSKISDGATDVDLKLEDGDILNLPSTVLEKIESLVKKVAKMDIKIDSGGRGRITDGGLGGVSELVVMSQLRFVALENESTRLEGEQPRIMETRFQQQEFLKS
ncbi:hypothetical protein Goari_016491 [Gossypium aridum]|uniref:Uncharacterized protein n=1 Tax=Gossypium aridum TaxID=34290 RepID=A0A7J8WJ51_GOSAI|nr:hypothetical protein [Gossypium aridum]